jgi:chromosome segregation ATPase
MLRAKGAVRAIGASRRKPLPHRSTICAARSRFPGRTGATAASGTGATNAGDAKEQEDPNSEKAWRKKFQAHRDKIAKAERELDILQREMEKAQVEYYPDPQKALTEQNTRKDINDKKAKIDAKQKELEQLKQGLSDLEDQLRKAGGDPGWAR